MPSEAFKTFRSNITQVDLMLKTYDEMKTPQRGKKNLDHLTRAALLFLCSTWEVYVEQVILESGKIIAKNHLIPSKLPKDIQKELARRVKDNKNNLSPIHFADDWKNEYIESITEATSKLNTPKEAQILDLFKRYLGVNLKNLESDNRLSSLKKVDTIIKKRGRIAHKIYSEQYLCKSEVVRYYNIINKLVIEIDEFLWDYLSSISSDKKPWRNTYKNYKK